MKATVKILFQWHLFTTSLRNVLITWKFCLVNKKRRKKTPTKLDASLKNLRKIQIFYKDLVALWCCGRSFAFWKIPTAGLGAAHALVLTVDFNHLHREDEELGRSQAVQSFMDAGVYAAKSILIWNIGGDRSFIDFLWEGCYEYVLTGLTDNLRLHFTTQEKSFQWELSILVLFVIILLNLF